MPVSFRRRCGRAREAVLSRRSEADAHRAAWLSWPSFGRAGGNAGRGERSALRPVTCADDGGRPAARCLYRDIPPSNRLTYYVCARLPPAPRPGIVRSFFYMKYIFAAPSLVALFTARNEIGNACC